MRRAAAITIGQSPRSDITGEITPLLGPAAILIEAGALDGLTDDQIRALAPADGDSTLVTLLRDGREVLVGRGHLLPRIQACIDRVQRQADVIMMLCTGTFPPFASARPVLYPEHLLFMLGRAVASAGRIGVLTPSARQIVDQERRWGEIASSVTVRAYSPYRPGDDLAAACRDFRSADVDVVALDCLGYTMALKQDVQQRVDRPALLARTVLARATAELLA